MNNQNNSLCFTLKHKNNWIILNDYFCIWDTASKTMIKVPYKELTSVYIPYSSNSKIIQTLVITLHSNHKTYFLDRECSNSSDHYDQFLKIFRKKFQTPSI